MLKYWQDAGKKSARVLKLAEKLETWLEHSDTVLSTAIDEEESEFLLLDLEEEITTGLYSDATSRDEFTALLDDVHKGDVQSLLSSMKSKLNAWKFNQALHPLRKALVHTATAKGIDEIFSLEVVNQIEDVDMKELFESTAKTTLVNTQGEVVGPKRLLLKLAALHNGWTFYQLLATLKGPFIATVKAVEKESSKEGVCCDAVFKKLDQEVQDLFDKAANMTLKSSKDQAVGRSGVYARLAGACSHTLSLMDATLSKHIKTIEQMIQNKSSNIVKVGDDEYVPIIDAHKSTLYSYLLRIRDLKEGETHYWKKQMFLDKGINVSKMKEACEAKCESAIAKKMSSKRQTLEAVQKPSGKRKKVKRFTG